MSKLTQKDRNVLSQKGITEEMLEGQVALFKEGIPPIELQEAATIGNGIIALSKEEAAKYAAIYQKKKMYTLTVAWVGA